MLIKIELRQGNPWFTPAQKSYYTKCNKNQKFLSFSVWYVLINSYLLNIKSTYPLFTIPHTPDFMSILFSVFFSPEFWRWEEKKTALTTTAVGVDMRYTFLFHFYKAKCKLPIANKKKIKNFLYSNIDHEKWCWCQFRMIFLLFILI